MDRRDLTDLIELADDRMYIGKQNGKNQVVDDSWMWLCYETTYSSE